MGTFDLGNGLFFSISVLTTTYILLSINWHGKTGPTFALINDKRRITINDHSLSFDFLIGRAIEINGHFCEK